MLEQRGAASALVMVAGLWLTGAAPARAEGMPAGSTASGSPAGPAREGGPPAASLGVSYWGWRGDFRTAPQKLTMLRALGFRLVSFVPTYAYADLDKIDLASGPDAGELGQAVEEALRAGFAVIVKPHLDPPAYGPRFDAFATENHSWRVHCPWRGFFDLDPMSDDYRGGIVFGALAMLKDVFAHLGQAATGATVRLELGAELMNSVVYGPERWEQLLAAAKKERHRLGLDGKVLLSHNFTHHLEIANDFVGRMNPARRRSFARYIRGLDVLSLSQYMDLTVALPAAERGRRLPSVDEVASALVLAETNFRKDILQGALGLRPAEVPPLHIGEFGVGRGGLKHPNLWDGAATPAEEATLSQEIARGHEGLARYLSRGEGRTVKSAVLWVTGPHYDIFGWEDPKHAIPEAAAAVRSALAASAR
jgi:hypothetical protein